MATETTDRESAKDPIIITSGEIFLAGTIDLLASADVCRPNLLFWDGTRETVGRRIRYLGVTYEAPVLHRSIGQAIRFPASVSHYGSAEELFSEFAEVIQEYIGLPEEIARVLSLWNGSTWLSDVLPSPPPLAMWGPDMSLAMTLFNLLRCVCRRGLMITGVSEGALRGLPMHLRPTFLINQPSLPRKLWQFCCASNHRGVLVPGKGGSVLDCVGSKAVFLGLESGANILCGEALRVSLPPAQAALRMLDEPGMLAQRFQARFEAYRLGWLTKEEEAGYRCLSFAGSELAQNLFACVRHEPDLISKITPLLESQQEETMTRRRLDPSFVILEVIWGPAHQVSEIRVKKITEELNVRLHARGEKWVYREEEVGWKLADLGFERHRNGAGKTLRFTREHIRLVHQQGRKFGLDVSPVEGCSDCAATEAIVPAM